MKTLKEFEDWYKRIVKSDKINKVKRFFKADCEDEYNEFVWEIMESPYTEYHYSLITNKNTSEEFRRDLWNRFDEHREKGAKLLLSKLDNNEDTDFHPDIIFYLGILADKKIEKERTLEYARKFTNSDNDYYLSALSPTLSTYLYTVKDFTNLSSYTESKSPENTCTVSPLSPNARRLGGRAGVHKGLDGKRTSKIPVKCPTRQHPACRQTAR